ncbi:unnamed protein product [Albugo candida]|uniref:Uncharacterized protein n=1 Tax=Albugo candida TaxID=65357 RepID=A0A024GIJ4_9STRA|nr:unnamed protein product [Albugo candida]|eukprot:CCI46580.1 unnamed protein product [Albugo candida]
MSTCVDNIILLHRFSSVRFIVRFIFYRSNPESLQSNEQPYNQETRRKRNNILVVSRPMHKSTVANVNASHLLGCVPLPSQLATSLRTEAMLCSKTRSPFFIMSEMSQAARKSLLILCIRFESVSVIDFPSDSCVLSLLNVNTHDE